LPVNAQLAEHLNLSDDDLTRVKELHQNSIVVDGSAVVYDRAMTLPVRYDRYSDGGVTATNHTVTIPACNLADALGELNACRRWISANPDKVVLCTSVADIEKAHADGLGGIVFGPQDTSYLETDLERVGIFYDLGIRVLQLTYQNRNFVGDGCGEPNPGGLSRFGISLVQEMQERGIVIDLSHCSHPTSFDAIARAAGPVVISHAHPAALAPHVRAKSDELLKAVAETGGVIGLTSLSEFVQLRSDGSRPTFDDYMTHMNYLIDLVGPDHVGVGLDLDETNTEEQEIAQSAVYPEFKERHYAWGEHLVENLTEATDFPNITAGLVAGGHDDETVRKIIGGNFLRVFGEVWR
jgi:membrane dipeptidase